jgi:hypothetical protein
MDTIPDNGNVLDETWASRARLGCFGGRHRAFEFPPVQRPYSNYRPRHGHEDET